LSWSSSYTTGSRIENPKASVSLTSEVWKIEKNRRNPKKRKRRRARTGAAPEGEVERQ